MESNIISGDRNIKAVATPDILTQANKEKFRRKLLIASRVLALLLIFVLAYFSYVYYQVGDAYKTKPCWSCGYYFGKTCDAVVLHTYSKNYTMVEELRKSIAEHNEIPVNLTPYMNQKYNSDFPAVALFNVTNETQN